MINLASDTSTKPSKPMLDAMCKAEVGDEQVKQDPTVTKLCESVAEMLGKEDAVFLPTGTMCNQISLLVHCQRGDEIICANNAHIYRSEGGGAAALAGAWMNTIDTVDGLFTAEQVKPHLRSLRPGKSPRSRVIAIEQTTNFGCGAVWSPTTICAIGQLSKQHNMALHMDGARLFNAVVQSRINAAEHVAACDSSWVDLSKGLGCPFGAVLVGSKDFIEAAWEWKFRLGGAMRQAGFMAAAGLYALEHNIERLQDDHDNAQAIATQLTNIDGIDINPTDVKTNIIICQVNNAADFAARLLSAGVKVSIADSNAIRMVTHLDFAKQDITHVINAITEVIKQTANP